MLVALTAALLAATTYSLLLPRLGLGPAIFGVIAILLCPLLLSQVTTLMLDIPVALGCLAAAAAFAQFLRSGRALPAVLFAVIAASTLLVKGNAGCLVLLPPIAIAATRRFERLRSPWLWSTVPIVLVLAGPWYLFTHKMSEQGYRGTFGIPYALDALGSNLHVIFVSAGAGCVVTAIAGTWLVLRRGRSVDPLWGSLFALIVSVLLFQAIIPVALDARYVLPALPPLFALAAFFVSRLSDGFIRSAAFAVLTLSLALGIRGLPHRAHLGVSEAAEFALHLMPRNNRALLVISDDLGESAAVSELVRLRKPFSDVFVVRGVRLLGGGGYNNRDYAPRYKTMEQVDRAIRTYRIPLLLLRDPGLPGEWAHIKQVAKLVDREHSAYQLVWSGKGGKLYIATKNLGLPGERELLTELSAPHALGGGNSSLKDPGP